MIGPPRPPPVPAGEDDEDGGMIGPPRPPPPSAPAEGDDEGGDMIGPPRPPPAKEADEDDDDDGGEEEDEEDEDDDEMLDDGGFGFNRLPLSNEIVLRGHTKVTVSNVLLFYLSLFTSFLLNCCMMNDMSF
jgi:WD repeat-containing protein 70